MRWSGFFAGADENEHQGEQAGGGEEAEVIGHVGLFVGLEMMEAGGGR
jgi:hypothetical protein